MSRHDPRRASVGTDKSSRTLDALVSWDAVALALEIMARAMPISLRPVHPTMTALIKTSQAELKNDHQLACAVKRLLDVLQTSDKEWESHQR